MVQEWSCPSRDLAEGTPVCSSGGRPADLWPSCGPWSSPVIDSSPHNHALELILPAQGPAQESVRSPLRDPLGTIPTYVVFCLLSVDPETDPCPSASPTDQGLWGNLIHPDDRIHTCLTPWQTHQLQSPLWTQKQPQDPAPILLNSSPRDSPISPGISQEKYFTCLKDWKRCLPL